MNYETMQKEELLEEMVKFAKERNRIGYLTPQMITDGIKLFSRLFHVADTPRTKSVSQQYLRHLIQEQERQKIIHLPIKANNGSLKEEPCKVVSMFTKKEIKDNKELSQHYLYPEAKK